jgi:hypothetical protein
MLFIVPAYRAGTTRPRSNQQILQQFKRIEANQARLSCGMDFAKVDDGPAFFRGLVVCPQ